jgi:hypothetical protein
MKVERTQLPLASASKRISQFAASRRVDAAPGLTDEEARKRRHQHKEDDDEEIAASTPAHAQGQELRALNITA